jgi:hypothetical protein
VARKAHPETAQAESFSALDYQCDPNLGLQSSQADVNWTRLTWSDLAVSMHDLDRTKLKPESRITHRW